MKFSLAATSALLLTAFATLAKADEYADAMKEWCDGLTVTKPDDQAMIAAGAETDVTVTRVPNDHQKTITGLDLYSVDQNGKAKYIKNVWHGSYELNQQSTIKDTIPSNATAGLYYYRVWVTNQINGMHGPDCLETSHTFRVSTASHQNADGSMYYAEDPDDVTFYHPEHFKGCFGLSVEYPQEGATVKTGEHVRISVNRDSASQTESLLKVDLYKSTEANKAEYIDTVWEGKERFVDAFTLKDHLSIPDGQYDADATYYYTLEVTSNKVQDETCTFHSQGFKVQKN
ncbi:uncharacterized protein BYT42DRAFT_574208 [Radiomyces spectabilis]|uniref:uncharacterized protein n=1 Tax=Radiomyces spectabilis TaxID=64574 RepID=UPI0022209415|nr:uncharacterized protein BYT42DRAFT_574208 [Radiomyces spectabilis]KAI8376320.1 hypothetical protein BYT42DRAFT_574208 [Radiomyces spectabilis]